MLKTGKNGGKWPFLALFAPWGPDVALKTKHFFLMNLVFWLYTCFGGKESFADWHETWQAGAGRPEPLEQAGVSRPSPEGLTSLSDAKSD